MVGLPPRFAIPTDVLESYPALALQGVSEFTGVVTIDDPLVQRRCGFGLLKSCMTSRIIDAGRRYTMSFLSIRMGLLTFGVGPLRIV
jgi:hypothetical protein